MANSNLFKSRDGVITTKLQRVKQVVEEAEEKPKRKASKRKVVTGVPLDTVDSKLDNTPEKE